jgi:hypothetical protein
LCAKALLPIPISPVNSKVPRSRTDPVKETSEPRQFTVADGQDQAQALAVRVLAASLARAFLHLWRGDYEACAHVAVPKIEAAARVP